MKKEKWQQLWTVMSKNIYFSLQTLRRGLREQGRGEEQPEIHRDRNSVLVYWRLLDRNVLCQDSYAVVSQHETTNCNTRVKDDRTSATSQIRDLSQMCHRLDKGRSFVIRGQAVTLIEFRQDLGWSVDVQLLWQYKCLCTQPKDHFSLCLESFYCQNHRLLAQLFWSSSVCLYSTSCVSTSWSTP